MGKQEQVPTRAIFVQGSLCGGWSAASGSHTNCLAFLRHSPPIPGDERFVRGIPAAGDDTAGYGDMAGYDATIRGQVYMARENAYARCISEHSQDTARTHKNGNSPH